MGEFLSDVRLAVRQLIRRPGFAVAAIASLALGIGLNTTLFSVVNAVLLRNSPVAAPERLVEIYSSATEDFPELTTSYPDYLDIRDGATAFEAVAAHAFVRGILSTGSRGELVTAETVTPNHFSVLGIRPALGRGFLDEEGVAPGAAPVVVLSHGLWQRRLGGRPDVLGQTIEVSGLDYTVVGVAPPDFPGTVPGIPTDFWTPVVMVEQLSFAGVQWTTDNDPGDTRLDRRGNRWLFVKGRLGEGHTLEEARAQVDTIFARLASEYPATNDTTTSSVHSAASIRFHPMLDGYVKAASAGLLVAVGLVLLIACANVANLLLARGTARKRELAVRAAIGAGRGRLIRQLLTEGLVLAAAGGALGTLVAWWAVRGLAGFGADLFPMRVDFHVALDPMVLVFAIGVTTLTALLSGLAPAWAASNVELVPALKATLEGGGGRRRAWRQLVTLRDTLVVGQLALSLVLLVAGALLARGLLSAWSTDIGFDPTPVSALSFNLQMNGYDEDRALAFRDRALRELRSLPGVTAVSLASRLPLAPDVRMEGIKVMGHHGPDDDGAQIDAVHVGADYFTVVGVPIVAGRAFTEDDVAQARDVAIVNETMARRYWPDGPAVGRLFYRGEFDEPPVEIVGVARDHKVRSVGEEPTPYLHFPAETSRGIGLLVRTVTPAVAMLPTLRDALWSLEPDIVFTEDIPAGDVADSTMAPTRVGAAAIGAFGALALLLAGVGLYGVIAYSVSLRTREVGIRFALGARRSEVMRLVLAQGGRLAIAGVVVGLLVSAGVGRVLESLLYGVSGFDPVAYSAAAMLLLVVAIGANVAPAFTAGRVDPVRALRSE